MAAFTVSVGLALFLRGAYDVGLLECWNLGTVS